MRAHPARQARWLVGVFLWALLGCPEAPPSSDGGIGPIWGREDLSAVAVSGPESALVATSGGAIYRTSDAGRSWSLVRSAGGASLRRLSMADEEVGWAIGPDTILHTRDGGRSWREQRAPQAVETREWRAVAAVDPRRAVIVGDVLGIGPEGTQGDRRSQEQ